MCNLKSINKWFIQTHTKNVSIPSVDSDHNKQERVFGDSSLIRFARIIICNNLRIFTKMLNLFHLHIVQGSIRLENTNRLYPSKFSTKHRWYSFNICSCIIFKYRFWTFRPGFSSSIAEDIIKDVVAIHLDVKASEGNRVGLTKYFCDLVQFHWDEKQSAFRRIELFWVSNFTWNKVSQFVIMQFQLVQ